MKNLSKTAQSFIEYLIIFVLIAIIAVGVYKLANKWSAKAEGSKSGKVHQIIDRPSKELCSFMMKQCQGRY